MKIWKIPFPKKGHFRETHLSLVEENIIYNFFKTFIRYDSYFKVKSKNKGYIAVTEYLLRMHMALESMPAL